MPPAPPRSPRSPNISSASPPALVRAPALPIDRAALNINMDMVSRSDVGELYVAGTYHTPDLAELVEQVAAQAPVTLLIGHDRPEDGVNDWTTQSDHALFHELGIPFLYFGVEDHPDYHKPTDDFSVIPLDFYVRAADTVAMPVRAADARLPEIYALRQPLAAPVQPEGPTE